MTRVHRALVWFTGLLVCSLIYAYAYHMDREIFHDETGLFNPIYTFLTTGRMTYPLHGQPEFMTVHPPTHYLVLASMMKFGLTLFEAAGVPLVVLAATLVFVIGTAGMPLHIGMGFLLGLFCGSVIWADFCLVRPDVHLTFAWFTGLAALESARYRNWSRGRLLIGAMLSTYAATIHYWGVAAVLTPVVYGIGLLIEKRTDRPFVRPRLAAMMAGAAIVGVPFLLLFVVPLFGPMVEMIQSVQGGGGIRNAVERHLVAYSTLAERLAPGLTARPLITLITYPFLMWRIPAVIPAAVLCAIVFRSVPFAVAGAILPVFVLLASQGKAPNTTFYLTPEITLLTCGVVTGLLALLARVARDAPTTSPRALLARVARDAPTTSPRTFVFAAGVIVAGCLIQIPTSMGSEWRWAERLHDIELSRAAALDVAGRGAVAGIVSLGPWFTGGGRFIWSAANELTEANRAGRDIRSYLTMVDFFVLDVDWWHALPDVAPLGTWYVERKLDLFGFVLPHSRSGLRQMNLLVTARPVGRVHGYFLTNERVQRFDETPHGPYVVSVFACASPVVIEQFTNAFYRFSFFYDAAPSPQSKVLLLLAARADSMPLLARQAGADCTQRDTVRGTLTEVDKASLLRKLEAEDQPIQIAESLGDVLAAAGSADVGEDLTLNQVPVEMHWAKANLPAGANRVLPLTVMPPEAPWGYAAVIPLRVDALTADPILVRIRAYVRRGEAGFGIVNRREDAFLARAFRTASSRRAEINLLILDGAEMGPLVIQNGRAGSQTDVLIEAIDAYIVAPLAAAGLAR